MLTIIAFLLTILGSINWLLIGLLQYDFVAGIFGFQASVFSRIIYIIIGASSVFLIIKIIKNKGVLPIFTWRNKKDVVNNIEKLKHKHDAHHTYQNVESSNDYSFFKEHQSKPESHETKGLFDEHFDDRGWLCLAAICPYWFWSLSLVVAYFAIFYST